MHILFRIGLFRRYSNGNGNSKKMSVFEQYHHHVIIISIAYARVLFLPLVSFLYIRRDECALWMFPGLFIIVIAILLCETHQEESQFHETIMMRYGCCCFLGSHIIIYYTRTDAKISKRSQPGCWVNDRHWICVGNSLISFIYAWWMQMEWKILRRNTRKISLLRIMEMEFSYLKSFEVGLDLLNFG